MTALQRVDTLPPPFVPEPISDAESATMFRAAVNLFRLWALTDEQAACCSTCRYLSSLEGRGTWPN
ncbi:hypothetical protein [Sphingomonas sp. 22176]|uniref:hypothetical protein n=1 Tax=Sphingomonas sp. 22176 TaxID=3453884 RepID=UPI003F84979B